MRELIARLRSKEAITIYRESNIARYSLDRINKTVSPGCLNIMFDSFSKVTKYSIINIQGMISKNEIPKETRIHVTAREHLVEKKDKPPVIKTKKDLVSWINSETRLKSNFVKNNLHYVPPEKVPDILGTIDLLFVTAAKLLNHVGDAPPNRFDMAPLNLPIIGQLADDYFQRDYPNLLVNIVSNQPETLAHAFANLSKLNPLRITSNGDLDRIRGHCFICDTISGILKGSDNDMKRYLQREFKDMTVDDITGSNFFTIGFHGQAYPVLNRLMLTLSQRKEIDISFFNNPKFHRQIQSYINGYGPHQAANAKEGNDCLHPTSMSMGEYVAETIKSFIYGLLSNQGCFYRGRYLLLPTRFEHGLGIPDCESLERLEQKDWESLEREEHALYDIGQYKDGAKRQGVAEKDFERFIPVLQAPIDERRCIIPDSENGTDTPKEKKVIIINPPLHIYLQSKPGVLLKQDIANTGSSPAEISLGIPEHWDFIPLLGSSRTSENKIYCIVKVSKGHQGLQLFDITDNMTKFFGEKKIAGGDGQEIALNLIGDFFEAYQDRIFMPLTGPHRSTFNPMALLDNAGNLLGLYRHNNADGQRLNRMVLLESGDAGAKGLAAIVGAGDNSISIWDPDPANPGISIPIIGQDEIMAFLGDEAIARPDMLCKSLRISSLDALLCNNSDILLAYGVPDAGIAVLQDVNHGKPHGTTRKMLHSINGIVGLDMPQNDTIHVYTLSCDGKLQRFGFDGFSASQPQAEVKIQDSEFLEDLEEMRITRDYVSLVNIYGKKSGILPVSKQGLRPGDIFENMRCTYALYQS